MIDKKIQIFVLLLGITLYLPAQVGVGTENPQALFHLDAKSSAATTNPATGTPSTARQSDDVVVTTDGKVGIGTIAPESKIEINTQGVAGVYPMQIKDGQQAVGKFLVSDANGVGTWKTVDPPNGAVYPIQILPSATYPRYTATQAPGGDFTVPSTGFYSAEIRWWAKHSPIATVAQRTITVLQLRKNGTVVDEFQYNTPILEGTVTVYVPLYAKANANDVLSIWVYPVEAPGNFVTVNDHGWTTAKVIYKELQYDF